MPDVEQLSGASILQPTGPGTAVPDPRFRIGQYVYLRARLCGYFGNGDVLIEPVDAAGNYFECRPMFTVKEAALVDGEAVKAQQ